MSQQQLIKIMASECGADIANCIWGRKAYKRAMRGGDLYKNNKSNTKQLHQQEQGQTVDKV